WLTPAPSRTAMISCGDIGATLGKASRPSILSVVCSSSASLMAPILCRPREISTISDRNRAFPRSGARRLAFVFRVHLCQFILDHGRLDLFLAQLQECSRLPFQVLQFIIVDIGTLILGEPQQKDRQLAAPIDDHRAIASLLALSRTRHALLDKAAA